MNLYIYFCIKVNKKEGAKDKKNKLSNDIEYWKQALMHCGMGCSSLFMHISNCKKGQRSVNFMHHKNSKGLHKRVRQVFKNILFKMSNDVNTKPFDF